MLFLGIVALVIVLAVLWSVATFNGLIGSRNAIDNSWSQIDVQLKRRYDLIPNLVEAVKGYAKHESSTLENLTRARASAMSATDTPSRIQAETTVGAALARVLAVAEAYPDLKANASFAALQEEIASTENRIAFARQAYNDQVLDFNNRVAMFPSSVVASMGGFSRRAFFETAGESHRDAPKVTF